jgi:phosphoserine aminotransferase
MTFPTLPQAMPAGGAVPAAKPATLPARPEFSSGPCAKRPGWSAEAVAARPGSAARTAPPGRRRQIKAVIDRTAALLGLPADYRVGIVPASDTGALEMAMWTMLGARPVDMLAWESFGEGWVTDAVKQLKLADCRVLEGPLRRTAGPFGRAPGRRCLLHLERHDLGRPRPRCRLDRRRTARG